MRTRLFRLIILALSAVLLLAVGACTSDPEPGSGGGAPAGEPAPGGTFTVVLPKAPDRGLNPHYGAAFDSEQVLRNAYDSLISEDPEEHFHPWLAKSWTVSPDGRTYEFRLRDDVTFTNGEKLDAAAVKTNLDVLRDPKYPAWTNNGLLQFSSVTDVAVIDPFAVRLTLSQPRADLLSSLAGLGGAIVAPSTLRADNATLTAGSKLIGSGPFIIDRVIQGQEIRFRKNPAYRWGPGTAKHQGAAYVDHLVVKFVPEASTRAGLLRSGEVDAIGTVKATDIPLFRDVSGFQYAQTGSAASPWNIMLNVTNGATGDVRVRRAISQGVDLSAIVDSVTKGTQKRAWSLISPDSKYFDAKYDNRTKPDLSRAKELLDEAGWKESGDDGAPRTNAAGQRLRVRLLASVPNYPLDDVLKAWQAQLRQDLGVDVELQYVENAQIYDLLAANDYEAFPRQVGGLDLSLQLNRAFGTTRPDLTFGQVDGITLGSVVGGSKLSDRQVDRWLVDATRATDQGTRKALFDKITGRILDQAVAIPLYTDRNSVAATGKVHNVTSLFDPPRNAVNGWGYDIAVQSR
ncbi:ABC transporter substrate-binding protein [Gordonia soli]|uniref:Putative peptide ABC transporter substrate-binding protein n=1 Tax=Gordonia soli NBRC 108243 TaxID=1223545 RepID=M0QGX8_9ACTN|nr:ABC transporter substrate-binding protein [Gordonia soli]GAC67860.1 putative peptide ABC transporter substrate-binding protein [Gordonia soli NBRC 108243]